MASNGPLIGMASAVAGREARPGWWPLGADRMVLLLVGLGVALLYLPTYWDLSSTVWATDEQGHGVIILCLSYWLLFKRRQQLADLATEPRPLIGWALVSLALLLYVLGRTQSIILFEVGSKILLFVGLLLVFKGVAAVRVALFPLFFLIFMIPLPGALVATVTTPLKLAVSSVAEFVLFNVGYPIGRTGVILTVGPYQLLVADACAGLNSMFTLEALGLLYMNLMNYQSLRRNITLAILIVPIAFVANVIRVMILILVTYHFGDAAGQGFVHGFAGMVLFMVALVLILVTDTLLGLVFKNPPPAKVANGH